MRRRNFPTLRQDDVRAAKKDRPQVFRKVDPCEAFSGNGNGNWFSFPLDHPSVNSRRKNEQYGKNNGALHAPECTRCTRSAETYNYDKTDEDGDDFLMWTNITKKRGAYSELLTRL
jgi:hypothetical protein